MCEHCQHDHDQNNSNSGFLMGIIFGAIIGAVVAIYFYKKDKNKVLEELKNKIQNFFDNLVKKEKPSTTPAKKKVTIPSTVPVLNLTPVKVKKPAKMFKK